MGKRGQALFDEANALGGIAAKARLASLARITSAEAATLPDASEVLQRIESAMGSIRAEFGSSRFGGKQAPAVAEAPPAAHDAAQLRRQIQTFLDLMSQRVLFLGNVRKTVQRVDEAAASAIGVERVSVWWLEAGGGKIACADLFERTSAKHSSGVELFARDFEPYFKALSSERTIAAHDAHTDARTSCFSQSYLKPLGINSMLDVPIWANRRMVGVICHEHVGPKRTWNADEERFAYLVSSFVALALERAPDRPKA